MKHVLFYSLGYKFDAKSKKILRTGTISVKSSPEGADIFLNGAKINSVTPDILSGLPPQDYAIRLEKDGFYSYQIPVSLRPSSAAEFDIALIPKIRYVEKLERDLLYCVPAGSAGVYGYCSRQESF
ncbi:MAG: PEGA domain-containing protein [Candidatus Omnitrophota bacterium]